MPAGLTLTSHDLAGDFAPPVPPHPEPPVPLGLQKKFAEDFSYGTGTWQIPGPLWSMWQGPGGFGYRPAFGTPADRQGGRDLPLFWSEIDLRSFRVLSRYLCETNGFAIGFLGRLTDYHLRKGYGWQACKKGVKKTPYAASDGTPTDPVVAKGQEILDRWRDQANWPIRSRKGFARWRRDGEVFGRFFRGDWGRLPKFRFVDPSRVGSPTGDTDGPDSFGIRTDPEDVEEVEAYHLWDVSDPATGRWVDADRIVHLKANVDDDVKRGLPDFFPVHEQLDGVRQLLNATLKSSTRQAKIAWVERLPTATAEQVRGLIPYQTTAPGQTTATSGYPGQVGPWPPGTLPYGMTPGSAANLFPPDGSVMRTEGNREFDPTPTSGGIPNYLAVEQAVLRGCGARWGMPEYFSGDASNNNFASAMVAGSPFAVAVEGSQLEWGCFERACALKVLELARDAGLLTHAEFDALDVEVEPPAVVNPEPEKDTSRREILHRNKVLSTTTWQQQEGLDVQHEAENFAAEAKREQAQQPQPAGPGTPGTTPPAGGSGDDADADADPLAAILGESVLVSEAAYDLLTEAGRTGLIKKQIVDRNGHKRTVWVKGGEPTAKDKATGKKVPSKPDPKAAAAENHELVKAAFADPASLKHEDFAELAGMLKSLSVEQLKTLQAQRKLKGGTTKADRIERLLTHAKTLAAKRAADAERGKSPGGVDYRQRDPNHPVAKAMRADAESRKVVEGFLAKVGGEPVAKREAARGSLVKAEKALQAAQMKKAKPAELKAAQESLVRAWGEFADADRAASGPPAGRDEAHAALFELMKPASPIKIRAASVRPTVDPAWKVKPPTEAMKKAALAAQGFLQKVAGNLSLELHHGESASGRAFCKKAGGEHAAVIAHSDRGDDHHRAAVAVHEIGHAIELHRPGLKEKAIAFVKYRCGDEKPVGLKDKFGGEYKADEVGKKDDFDRVFGDKSAAYYVGKDYGGAATELVSMGVEQLYRDPVKFAKADPEYFQFIVSALRG